ncbi:MAG: anaerobic ribonucleoside-triphosphate reductase activating protein [Cetobacterium sp.]|uniref:anaerobic ribonucleoside-triphosphate reductase activating protein n=1 Tax=unclassified Cetobacterium TaxID=2630983 RepID=UPI00163B9E85|nr:anaerobic ribonucleoside-triphosphate reductase activating protein [Cetobacterium sp. 2A]MBC2856924.1 anaerobic ribonucleoside-triphosphate reductase activating protein [Cetobacterium sp. 2A]
MNYSGIKYTDMINGKGIRVSLFVSGCNHYCKDCFNKDTWDPNYGSAFTEKEENDILEYFKKYEKSLKGLSLLGGDPTYPSNIAPLISFLKKFKNEFPEKDIWIWSGYTWEDIINNEDLISLISLCDILIEGKFDITKKDLSLKWRGSYNQRVIDIKKSLSENTLIEYK